MSDSAAVEKMNVDSAEQFACNEETMKNLTQQEDGGISDRHVWSAIRYLDPERNCQNGDRPIVVPVVVCLIIWFIFLTALHHLTI